MGVFPLEYFSVRIVRMNIRISEAAAEKIIGSRRSGMYFILDLLRMSCCTFAFSFGKGHKNQNDIVVKGNIVRGDITAEKLADSSPSQLVVREVRGALEDKGDELEVNVSSRAYAMLPDVVIDYEENNILKRPFRVLIYREKTEQR